MVSLARAYYVPGTYPQEFKVGNFIQVHISTLSSFDTELPYDYYSMPFCKPAEGVKRIANTANPGTILEGIRIENSPYNFTMKVKQTGIKACSTGSYGPLTAKEVKSLHKLIDDHYRVNMILDNLPVTSTDEEGEVPAAAGAAAGPTDGAEESSDEDEEDDEDEGEESSEDEDTDEEEEEDDPAILKALSGLRLGGPEDPDEPPPSLLSASKRSALRKSLAASIKELKLLEQAQKLAASDPLLGA
ncbi:putative phagocytic receptor 1a [Tetrabaena socialis]|uniref:Transmembrane 9 superfamily member n=1 Tax=Tetrabaena socialis TaxID=47790 RepID=A0A2J7ZZU7_9CHLO|nr:putative phagocytic receptor 1a [Tetrabaena socialis]|eukprot:PNH05768.1 putative phagocytic receptor 1a [Tetrabaena socialis]